MFLISSVVSICRRLVSERLSYILVSVSVAQVRAAIDSVLSRPTGALGGLFDTIWCSTGAESGSAESHLWRAISGHARVYFLVAFISVSILRAFRVYFWYVSILRVYF